MSETRAGALVVTSLLLACACGTTPPEPESSIFLAERLSSADKHGVSTAASDFHAAPWTLSDETRIAMVTPLASSLAFAVDVPEKAELRLATGLYPLEGEGGLRNAEFRVHVDYGDERRTVLAERVRQHRAGEWIDHAIDLARWSGRTIQLVLEVEPPPRFLADAARLRRARSQFLALWGNPVVRSSDMPERDARDTNVVLISIDCVRADHIGAYGYAAAKTPVIDALAGEGVLFRASSTTAPSTLPSHASMFTGLTPLLHRASKWRARDPKAPYLPRMLASHGFEVNAVVTGPYLSQAFSFEEGFHAYKFMYDPRAGDAVDAAIAMLDRRSSRRQFMFLHLFDAHAPYVPPRAFLPEGVSREDAARRVRRIMSRGRPPSEDETRELIALYDGEIAYVDRELGRFFDALRGRGLYENSLIVLTADHGEAFHEHGHGQHSRTLYEEIVHVPLIVKWPLDSPRGVTDALTSHIDILPTVLNEAGLGDMVSGLGVDLRELADGRAPEARTVFSEFEWLLENKTLMKIALRGDDIKYIATLESAPGEDMALAHLRSEELYSLADDPAELVNSIEERSEARDRMRATLDGYLKTVSAARSTSDLIEIDETTLRQLESLGYIYH